MDCHNLGHPMPHTIVHISISYGDFSWNCKIYVNSGKSTFRIEVVLLFYTEKSNLTLFKPFFIESHVQHRKRRLEWGQFRGQDREEKSGIGAKPEAFADPEKSSTRLHGWVREAGGWAKKTLCWIHRQISLHDTSRSQTFTLDSAISYHNCVL